MKWMLDEKQDFHKQINWIKHYLLAYTDPVWVQDLGMQGKTPPNLGKI